MLPEEYIVNCARSMDWKVQTDDKVELYWDLTIQNDSGTQQARYYPS